MNRPRNLALALQILLAASAFGVSWPDKPAAAEDVRNIFAPRPDYLAVCYAMNEASGTTLTNIGKRASWNGTLDSATWTSDAYGAFPNLASYGPTVALAKTYPRGTIFCLAKSGSAAARQIVSIYLYMPTASNPNSINLALNDSANTAILTYTEASGNALTLTQSLTFANTDWVPIAFSWGEHGKNLYTTAGTQSAPTHRAAVVIPAGSNLNLATDTSYSQTDARMHVFAWWDYQLTEREIRELLADPFLPTRPNVTSNGLYQTYHVANPVCGRPTKTSLTWQIAVPEDDEYATWTRELDWRIAYVPADAAVPTDIASTGVIDMSAATTTGWVEVRQANAGLPSTITVTGLSANTHYVWRAEYRYDDGDPQAFPGGIGYAPVQQTTGAPFNVIVSTDCHSGGIYSQSQPIVNIRRGIDATGTGFGAITMEHGFISAREQAEWCFENGCAFTIDLGDSTMGEPFDGWTSVRNDTFKSAPYYQVHGNHEDARGDSLEVAFGGQEQTAQGLVRARYMFPNPTGATYPEGGEDEGCPADPYGGTDGDAYCPGVSWLPGAASCEGDYVVADAEWDTRAEARVQTEQYIEFNTTGLTWAAKLGILEEACSNGLGNYYGFSWGEATFWVLDNYLYSAVGNDLQGDIRIDAEDWTYGPQEAWLESGMAASTKPWQFVFQHMNAGGVEGDDNGTDPGSYGRGSGATNTTTAERWLKGVMRQHGAVEFKGHDHGLADTEDGGLQIITSGVFGSAFRFVGEADDPWDPWDYGMDYGDPTMEGHNEPHIRHISGDWGFGIITVTDANTATYRYYRTSVNQKNVQNQTSSDVDPFKQVAVGEVLTVGAGGNITLSGTPKDVMVICAADKADFLQYGATTPIYDNSPAWGGFNVYDRTIQDWGSTGSGLATIDLGAADEPHIDAVVASSLAEGTLARVHWAPRVTYTTTLHRAVSNPTYVPLEGTVRGSSGLHYRGD